MTTGVPLQKEPVIFGQLMEALVHHAMREHLGEEHVRHRLKAIGVDTEQPLMVAYSVPVWFGAFLFCAEQLYPQSPHDEALYQLGRKVMEGHSQTQLGRAAFALIKQVGWERSAARLTRHLRTANNFTTAGVHPLSDGGFEVTLEVDAKYRPALGPRPAMDPYFMRGVLDMSMELAGAPLVAELRPQTFETHRFRYLLRRRAQPAK